MAPTKAVVLAAVVLVLACGVDGFGVACPPRKRGILTGVPAWPTPMKENLKVAFFGDGGVKPDSSALLLRDMIRRGADFIIHMGDFDYQCTRLRCFWFFLTVDLLGRLARGVGRVPRERARPELPVLCDDRQP